MAEPIKIDINDLLEQMKRLVHDIQSAVTFIQNPIWQAGSDAVFEITGPARSIRIDNPTPEQIEAVKRVAYDDMPRHPGYVGETIEDAARETHEKVKATAAEYAKAAAVASLNTMLEDEAYKRRHEDRLRRLREGDKE